MTRSALRTWGISATAACAILALALACAAALEPGLKGRKDVLMFEDFESPDWFARWGMKKPPQNFQLFRDPSADEHGGKAVAKILFPKGENYGSGWSLELKEPLEEAYLRYYVKWDKDFDFDQGGKTPGLMGWAPGKQAGWGGRVVHGDDGFSTRICWGRRGKLNMYTYHADMKGPYGDDFATILDGRKDALVPGQWYCIELHMKLNTPGTKPGEKGKNDGLVELWIDGKPAGKKTDVRFRDIPQLKITQLFVNAYFGGLWSSPKDQYIYYDNMALAKSYIGPVGAKAEGTETEGTRKVNPPPGYGPGEK